MTAILSLSCSNLFFAPEAPGTASQRGQTEILLSSGVLQASEFVLGRLLLGVPERDA